MSRLSTIQTKSNLIPATAFTQLPYWKVLSSDEQKLVEKESQELARALFHEGASKLEQGKHLAELQKALEPYRVFVRHLKNFRMSMKTAYRRIGEFNNAKRRFPEPVLQALLARGLDIVGESSDKPFGKYTPVMKSLPVPKNADKYQIDEWAQKVEQKYKEYRSDLRNGREITFDSSHPAANTLMKAAFRHVRIRMKRVPKNLQRDWLKQLTGYLMNEIGVSSQVTMTPNEAPEDFRRGPGKPRSDAASA